MQYNQETNHTTDHHGHPADCLLAIMNVFGVQMNMFAMDTKLLA